MSRAPSKRQAAKAYAFARRLQKSVAMSLRSNIMLQEDGSGNPFVRLWADTAVFPGGRRSDRAGEPALIETAELLSSIRPGSIERRGNTFVCRIVGKEYGLRLHHGFASPPPNVIGRTLAARKAIRLGGESSGMVASGDAVVLKKESRVPARPWISLSQSTIESMVGQARR